MKAAAESNTEEIIKQSAREVFIQKGLDGARMQDIADKAGINKALLHYYFRSKEKLFEIIFEEERKNFTASFSQIVKSDLSIIEKIQKIVELQIDNYIERPYLPIFILNELGKRPEVLMKRMEDSGIKAITDIFHKQVIKEIKNGILKSNVNAEQLMINMMSLVTYPFMAKPFIMAANSLEEEQFKKMMKKRKKDVAEFIISSIKA